MRNRTRMIGAAAVATTALAAGITTVAVASAADAQPGAAKTMSASGKPAGSKAAGERQGREAMAAAVGRELHVSAVRVGAALRPLFAAGRAEPSSPLVVAAARSLGVSTQQLNTALMHAKQTLAAGQ
jgi:hypothetical protein